jgi:hypothetical protein
MASKSYWLALLIYPKNGKASYSNVKSRAWGVGRFEDMVKSTCTYFARTYGLLTQ